MRKDARPAPMPAAIVLRRAADLIEEHGWFSGTRTTSAGRYCAVLAINAVECSPLSKDEAKVALIRHIGEPAIIKWNDRKHSAKPVVVAMRATARKLEHES